MCWDSNPRLTSSEILGCSFSVGGESGLLLPVAPADLATDTLTMQAPKFICLRRPSLSLSSLSLGFESYDTMGWETCVWLKTEAKLGFPRS